MGGDPALSAETDVSAERLGAILGAAAREAKAVAKRRRSGARKPPPYGPAPANAPRESKEVGTAGVATKTKGTAGRLSPGFSKGLYARVRGLNLQIARETARAIMAFAARHGATVIVFERLKGFRPKASGRKGRGGGGAMKARFHAWLHRALTRQVEATWTEQGGMVAYVNAWGTSAWAYDGTGKVVRPTGRHDRAIFSSGKEYDADLNAAYNIGAKYWVSRLEKSLDALPILARLLDWSADEVARKAALLTPANQNGKKASGKKTPAPALRKEWGRSWRKRAVVRRPQDGPRTAPRAPATLSTLWRYAMAMQVETPTTKAMAA